MKLTMFPASLELEEGGDNLANKIKRMVAAVLLILLVFSNIGCKLDPGKLLKSDSDKPQLIKAEIHFTDKDILPCYVMSLGVEEKGQVYVGGASLNYIYDKDGNIIGSYNYQRVDYIKILP